MTYEQAIASGAFTPSAHALQVDAFIDAHPPQTHPEFWQFGGGATGWIYVGPNAGEGSRSEWADWKNGQQSFGSDGTADGFTSAAYVGSFAQMNDVSNGIYRDKNGNIIPEEVVNAGYWYDHVNETMHIPGSLADTLPYHPETFEAGSWVWDPQVGWFNNDDWVQTTGGTYFSANNPNAPDNTPTNTNGGGTNNGTDNGGEPQPIGWYWSGSEWLPFYQGEAPPAGLPQGWVAPTSTKPSSPPQNAGTNNGGSDPNNNGSDPSNNGGTDPNNNGGTDPQPEPEPPPLFTPDGSMFFQGLFNASDVLYRDGGTIQSPYYNNARTNILNQLAEQAAANGRTQNTAEEIRLAQNQTPSLSATGLFNPDYAALLKGMGIG